MVFSLCVTLFPAVDPVFLSLPILALYMSGARHRVDLDYAVLHSAGRREPKIRGIEGDQKKSMANLDIQTINITSNFENFLDS